MNLKFGAKPAVHTLESMHKGIVLSQHLDALGTPPASSDDYMAAVFKQVGSQDLGMMGNDIAGCCVVPTTVISGPQQKAAYRMSYSGDLITFTLLSGKRLTVTPNHPVLTTRGFVSAKFIQNGDYLVSTRGAEIFPRSASRRVETYFNHAPATANEKFRSLSVSGDPISKIMPRAVNFHGDGQFVDGNVDVVTTNGLLRNQMYATLCEPHGKNQIGATRQLKRLFQSASATFKQMLWSPRTTHRNVSLSGYRATLRDSHAGISEADRLKQSPQREARRNDGLFQRLSADPAFSYERLQGLARYISLDPNRKVSVPTLPNNRMGSSARPEFEASRFETSLDGIPTDPHLPSHLCESFPGFIAPERIVNVENQLWQGHTVYDFSTDAQWYIANGVLTHNCTIADQGHLEMLWSANTGKMIQASADDVLNEYKRLSGWNGVEDDPSDTGLMIADVCKSMETTGFMGDKFTGFADVMPINLPHARWSIQLFGAAKLGIFVPQSAMDQFDAGKGWTYTGDNNIVGRHDVPAVMYKNNVWFVITWGRLISMGPAFFSHYVTEVKAPLALNWCRQGNTAPNKLSLSQLQAELSWEGPVG